MGSWEYPTAVGLNVARGILPTVSSWDTDPSSLANITDGDMSSVSGEGVLIAGGAGSAAFLVVDFGRSLSGVVLISLDAKISTSSASIYVDQYDGSAWSGSSSSLLLVSSSVYSHPPVVSSFISNAYQIRLRWYPSAAATLTVKYYELVVLEVV